uniref:Uncharacterized protein n=1 Tax=Nelumbo nucifera TaxID=4432 RepID=A0A822ZNB2_NELNU|nr:TPA_asm: hypothetical protein HUJ06_016324 [Nelumbo nucifera]
MNWIYFTAIDKLLRSKSNINIENTEGQVRIAEIRIQL